MINIVIYNIDLICFYEMLRNMILGGNLAYVVLIYWSQSSLKNSQKSCISGPLTHLPLVPHVHVSELGQHWFR